ncbi:MAG: amidophosphoribosyltransferase [Lentisphaerae bacterium]|nr:amidophosphoribosyltransferase [Lentisphaerota bacterium]
MGGFFGVISENDCVADLFYGTDYHSHLGTKRAGMAVTDRNGIIRRFIHDITNAQFRSKFDSDLPKLAGKCGVGVISDMEDQPLVICSHLGTYAIVTVGKINNIDELAEHLFNHGQSHFAEMSTGEYNPTEVIASLINIKPTVEEGIAYAQEVIDGSCSVLLMLDNTLYAARDRYGRTPVVIGKRNGAHAVAMESTALPNLDFETECELGPSEIVKLTADEKIQLKAPGECMQICSFFWVYFGYPSSNYEGTNTETVRYQNGELLAEGDDVDVDSVCGIPDSGVAHAIGYSNARKKPYMRALVKYTPTWPRSFMPTSQEMRNLVAKMKLVPVDHQISGKKLLFCDDSIVRGNQFKSIAKRLYERGALEVHMRSASPPLLFPCRYLNFSRSKSTLDLAARRVINTLEGGEPSEEVLQEYITAGSPKNLQMIDEIRKGLGLTSLKYQTIEKMIAAIGLPKEKVCTYCFDGCAGCCSKCKK